MHLHRWKQYTETIFVDKWEICPNQMQCIYEPNKTVPMIEQMMKSLTITVQKMSKVMIHAFMLVVVI